MDGSWLVFRVILFSQCILHAPPHTHTHPATGAHARSIEVELKEATDERNSLVQKNKIN